MLEYINGIIWGPCTLLLVLGAGLYLSFRCNFLQLRMGYVFKNTILKRSDEKERGSLSPFQALTTALAGTIGTGNIIGVASAIALGGPGAIFWMWVAGFLGMMVKYAEVYLAILFRTHNINGEYVGGPMYYIERGLNMPKLAAVFAALTCLAALGIGNMTQANSIANALVVFSISPLMTGIVIAIFAALVILGGIKRIGLFCEKFIPLMTLLYTIATIYIIVRYFYTIPAIIQSIMASAFGGRSILGGFAGAGFMQAIKIGVSRGVFTNEAGIGSSSIAHAAANTRSPHQQALWGVLEVFFDTIFMCTLSAFAILAVPGLCPTSPNIMQMAMATIIPYGAELIAIFLLFFAFSTILCWCYYGEKALEFLYGTKHITPYRVLFVFSIVIGAISKVDVIWQISDIINGMMILPNMFAVIALSRHIYNR